MSWRLFHALHVWGIHGSNQTPATLAGMRIVTGLVTLLFLLPDPALYASLQTLPEAIFRPPPGPISLLGGFPSQRALLVLDAIVRVAFLFQVLGLWTSISSLAAGVGLLLLKGILFSVGKVNHEIIPVLVPLVMAFSGWGRAWSMDAWLFSGGRRPGSATFHSGSEWCLPVLALAIAFMMFTAGLPKLIGGWLDPTTHASLGHIINQHITKGRQALLLPLAYAVIDSAWWELLDWATVVLELGFLAALLRPVWFQVFVYGAVLFHIGVYALMDLAFTANIVGYLLFLDWLKITRPVVRRSSHRSPPQS